MEAEELLLRVNSGEALSERELREVAEQLELVDSPEIIRKPSYDDAYSLLLVLSRARAKQYRHIVERFLNSEDSITVSLVLETLCLDWQETEAYLERVVHFALGDSADGEDDIRQTSIRILGEYLAETRLATTRELAARAEDRRRQILMLLLSYVEDDMTDTVTRTASYRALLRAAGFKDLDIPSPFSQLDFAQNSEDIRWDIVSEFRAELETASH